MSITYSQLAEEIGPFHPWIPFDQDVTVGRLAKRGYVVVSRDRWVHMVKRSEVGHLNTSTQLLMTIITCGLWLFVWALLAIGSKIPTGGDSVWVDELGRRHARKPTHLPSHERMIEIRDYLLQGYAA